MALLFAPECRFFLIALVVMLCLVAIEVMALFTGASLSDIVDNSFDFSSVGVINWFNIGGVPLIILLILIFAWFSALGFCIQGVASGFYHPIPQSLAVIGALFLTIPAVRESSRLVARFVPQDETYAVEVDDFIGHIAKVTVGPLDEGLPGLVRVKDKHGNYHKLRARAAPNVGKMVVGEEVLLADMQNHIFIAIPFSADE
ncbi:OB-fold-containig protein [Bartonella sp. HY761]|uniref:OB-fold-containig protein n=1 Tax=Bartonella sp. HY761 TaxID=2979330 RepID=UPI0022057417|nr:OB-fold-containig protein [Bartonella sp. HY761]UXN07028.1 YqiJ family protein [Bartonella sp. HY761]